MNLHLPMNLHMPMNGQSSSPVRARRPHIVPDGFLPSPRPRSIAQMTTQELHDLFERNALILASPTTSTNKHVRRIASEQVAIRKRLIALEGPDAISAAMRSLNMGGDDDMHVEHELPKDPVSGRILPAKQRALAQYDPTPKSPAKSRCICISIEEAMEIDKEAHANEQRRRQRTNEKRKKLGLPIKGEILSKEETEARIWAFINYKPTESDLEDIEDDDIDVDSDDQAVWFEDCQSDDIPLEQEDIIEPDEDFSNIIKVDYDQVLNNTVYHPRLSINNSSI